MQIIFSHFCYCCHNSHCSSSSAAGLSESSGVHDSAVERPRTRVYLQADVPSCQRRGRPRPENAAGLFVIIVECHLGNLCRHRGHYLFQVMESMLNVRLPIDPRASLRDGVLLCCLVNHLFPDTISVIHTATHPKVSGSDDDDDGGNGDDGDYDDLICYDGYCGLDVNSRLLTGRSLRRQMSSQRRQLPGVVPHCRTLQGWWRWWQ